MRTLSQATWVDAAFRALAEGGIAALRVEPLATQLGVTKGSFYHHFADRRALLDAVLDEWEQRGTTEVIEATDAEASSPADRLRRLAHRTMTLDPVNDAIENAMRSWAATDTVAAAAIARVDERRLDYVTTLLRAAGLTTALARRRSRMLYRVLIGEFVWRSAGGPPASRADIDDLVDLLLRE